MHEHNLHGAHQHSGSMRVDGPTPTVVIDLRGQPTVIPHGTLWSLVIRDHRNGDGHAAAGAVYILTGDRRLLQGYIAAADIDMRREELRYMFFAGVPTVVDLASWAAEDCADCDGSGRRRPLGTATYVKCPTYGGTGVEQDEEGDA